MWKKIIVTFIIMAAVLIAAVSIGNVPIPVYDIPAILFGKAGDGAYRDIIMELRIPRIINALITGGALAVTGLVIQTVIKNPLGEPYMLGISSGAALGAVAGLISGREGAVGILAFIFAVSVSCAVYFLSLHRGEVNTVSLILTGVVINFLLASMILLILSFYSGKIKDYFFWTMGDLGSIDYQGLIRLFITAGAGIGAVLFWAKDLDMLAINEESAYYSGVNTAAVKRNVFIAVSFVVAAIVSSNGIIGFVGIVVPHAVKILCGKRHTNLILNSFIYGGIFLVVCDTIGRSVISGMEIPVGVVTSIIGAPVFLWILKKNGDIS